MCEQCFVQAENYSNKSLLPVMKEGLLCSHYGQIKINQKLLFQIL